VPVVVLIAAAVRVGLDDPIAFESLVLNTWQPKMAFFVLAGALIGFYLPGRKKKD
jgi:hypothetical protein